MSSSPPPAKLLTGRALPGGWRVVAPLIGSTGGNFSEGYLVEGPDGIKGFLKALDYSRAFKAPDVSRAMEAMTTAYNFERDLLTKCREQRLSKIVIAIASGKVEIPGAAAGGIVEYLIFELAEGDIRKRMDANARFDLAFALRSLHHVASGLRQLHNVGIAHQDLKPSNVLVFGDDLRKLADLGRAAYRGHSAPHEDYVIPGDPAYAPPELLYDYVSSEWPVRRFGCDAYLLGSMMLFLVTGMSASGLLVSNLHEDYRPFRWAGTFEEVLPYLREAFGQLLESFEAAVPTDFQTDLSEVARQLCDPDPRLRGHPRDRAGRGNPFSLERYVTRFDVLASRAEFQMRQAP